jgi:glycosyltransferase involved in cell wall biosynthesis
MAACVPVIATDVGGAREQILHGVTGLLTPRRDHAALAAALVEMAANPARRKSFAQAAQERIRAEFSLDRMLDDYARLCGLDGM